MTQDYGQWGKFKRRLEQVAQRRLKNNADGYAIVSVRLLMNASGQPIQWTEPEVCRMEPANADILNMLAGKGG